MEARATGGKLAGDSQPSGRLSAPPGRTVRLPLSFPPEARPDRASNTFELRTVRHTLVDPTKPLHKFGVATVLTVDRPLLRAGPSALHIFELRTVLQF